LLLESAAIKLSSVVTDLHGVTGRDIMDHLIAGERSPKALAQLARARARRKIAQLEAALEGAEFFTPAHAALLARIDRVNAEIARLSEVIETLLAPHEEQLQQAESMPGWGRRAAEDAERANALYRERPLRWDELALTATCDGEPMTWRPKADRDSFKEAWLCFENDRGRFPLYPGQHVTICYSYVVDDGRWGPWLQRAVRLPTRHLSVDLIFPLRSTRSCGAPRPPPPLRRCRCALCLPPGRRH
jgi:hypothetical protein